MSFDLIIFDYDGVLVDSLSDAISAGAEFCRLVSYDPVPTKETIESLEIMTYSEIAHSIGMPPEQAQKFSSHIFERFQDIGPSMAFFPEIESLLHRIASKNIAIISGNARHVISAKLAAHGLAEEIPCIFGAYEPGGKAEKICKACNHYGVDVELSCMIGDSASDIRYAKRAGVQEIQPAISAMRSERVCNRLPQHGVGSSGTDSSKKTRILSWIVFMN
jgi:HAD superfamily hydrolase (TIGR01549 family)